MSSCSGASDWSDELGWLVPLQLRLDVGRFQPVHEFKLVEDLEANGMPVWKSEGKCSWIYRGLDDRWYVSNCVERDVHSEQFRCNRGNIFTTVPHELGVLPHDVPEGTWQFAGASSAKQNEDIVVMGAGGFAQRALPRHMRKLQESSPRTSHDMETISAGALAPMAFHGVATNMYKGTDGRWHSSTAVATDMEHVQPDTEIESASETASEASSTGAEAAPHSPAASLAPSKFVPEAASACKEDAGQLAEAIPQAAEASVAAMDSHPMQEQTMTPDHVIEEVEAFVDKGPNSEQQSVTMPEPVTPGDSAAVPLHEELSVSEEPMAPHMTEFPVPAEQLPVRLPAFHSQGVIVDEMGESLNADEFVQQVRLETPEPTAHESILSARSSSSSGSGTHHLARRQSEPRHAGGFCCAARDESPEVELTPAEQRQQSVGFLAAGGSMIFVLALLL
jgi:hypothetical protein